MTNLFNKVTEGTSGIFTDVFTLVLILITLLIIMMGLNIIMAIFNRVTGYKEANLNDENDENENGAL